MISDVLISLKDHLNAWLNPADALSLGESGEDKVVFIDGEKMDPITFKLGAVSAVLLNIEEDNTLCPPDRYKETTVDGRSRKIQPEIRMNLYILFVVRFKQYEQGLRYLSRIIRHFQNRRVLNHQNTPELSKNIDQLIMELMTLPFSEQNELWHALKTTYHPSVLYRVRMLVFQDEDAMEIRETKEKDIRTST